ncbi:MAG TPA: hypothetical protein VF808_08235 [Ktedonobacterales bacterium]
MPLPTGPNTLGVLQALQSIIIAEALVGGVSLFATLSAADTTRYGVSKAVLIGRSKDFKDAYLPQCALWIPELGEKEQPVEVMGYSGRVFDDIEITVQAFADLRTDWYAGEQKILQLRDALWPALLHHIQLGATVATVIESDAIEGRGLCYESIGGVEYRCYEAIVICRQQWAITGGITQ